MPTTTTYDSNNHINTLSSASILSAQDASARAQFSAALAINGQGVSVVGAHGDSGGRGGLYVVTPDELGNSTQIKLTAPEPDANDWLGYSVAINDEGVIVAAALKDDSGGRDAGAVYVYSPDSEGNYGTPVKLVAPDAMARDYFGSSVSINAAGDIAVGAAFDNGQGSVYIYSQNAEGDYATPIKLSASEGASRDYFGYAVSIADNGLVAVGAYGDDDRGSGSGSVHVFSRDADGSFAPPIKLTAPDGASGDAFGKALFVNEKGIIAVAAPLDDTAGKDGGSVYVYVPQEDGTYAPPLQLTAPDGEANDRFGQAVQVTQSGQIVVGAYGDDDAGKDAGAIYIYSPDATGGYGEPVKLTAPNGHAGDYFGAALAVNANGDILVGAYGADDHGTSSGSAYLFRSGSHEPVTLYEGASPEVVASILVISSAQPAGDEPYTAAVTNIVPASASTADVRFDETELTSALTVGTDASGRLTLSLDPALSMFDYLTEGESVTLTFNVALTNGAFTLPQQQVTVTINGSNDSPQVEDISVSLSEDSAAIEIAAQFSDADTGDSHSFSIDTAPTKGTVTNNEDGTFAYDPADKFDYLAEGEQATDTFTYTVTDKLGLSQSKTVTLTIINRGGLKIEGSTGVITGTEHYDWVDYSNIINPPNNNLISLNYPNLNTGVAAGDSYISIENVIGSSGDDRVFGDENDNTLRGGDGKDQLNGGSGDDTLEGGEGDDRLLGDAGNDTFNGGQGKDYFSDSSGSDTYRYNLGDGDDTISDHGRGEGEIDTLVLGEGIMPADVVFSRSGSRYDNYPDLLMTFADGGTVTVKSQHSDKWIRGLEKIIFADGTMLDRDDIIRRTFEDAGDEADRLFGSDNDDTIYGRGGNDTIQGNKGDDTIDGGLGDDTIYGQDGGDTLRGGDGKDQLNGGSGDDTLEGGEGDDRLLGDAGNDTFNGGQGKDYFSDSSGSDTYRYNLGDGDDTISDHGRGEGEIDTLVLGEGIMPADVVFSRSGSRYDNYPDLLMTFADGGTVTVKSQHSDKWIRGLEKIIFADGTMLDRDDIIRRTFEDAGDEADRLFGSDNDDTIYGRGGNDTIQGNKGDDTIDGGLGDDTIYGQDGGDTLRGGDGKDQLNGGQGKDYFYGGLGNDTFIFTDQNFGTDKITDFTAGEGSEDVIEFASDIFADYAAVIGASEQQGGDTIIRYDEDNTILLQGVSLSDLHQDDFRFV
ncbi:VCBS domain-containing protein [Polycladidibacter hongkongensis]|uniref:VCBS domain-containing protein n=1 Tax=Polycladidibacter hongkongensis TaxID=1647556 RepID=UPI00082E0061|nr:VCBS domain-containing protein [Pseudovibrio hongkongensis]